MSLRELRPGRGAHTRRLAQIQERFAHGGRAAPGLTTHQAKGGEWDVVGVCLMDEERQTLARRLSVTEDTHRKLYVACAGDCHRAVEVV